MNAATAYALAEVLRQFPSLKDRVLPASGDSRQILMMMGRARWRYQRPAQLHLFSEPARPGPKPCRRVPRQAPWIVAVRIERTVSSGR